MDGQTASLTCLGLFAVVVLTVFIFAPMIVSGRISRAEEDRDNDVT